MEIAEKFYSLQLPSCWAVSRFAYDWATLDF